MKQLGITVLVLGVLSYAAWHIVYPTRTVHFRMTYEVETPEGMMTGSGVLAVSWGIFPEINGRNAWASTKGEAIVVDLGKRGTFYALLSTPSQPGGGGQVGMLIDVFGLRAATDKHDASSVHNFAAVSGRRDVRYDQPWPVVPEAHRTMASILPILVRFKDETDPRTVEAVDPLNLSASFGAGVRLGRVIIEITKEPVTSGIQKRLSWLGRYPEPYLDPDNPKLVEAVASAPLKRLLRHGYFRSYAP